MVYIGNIYLRFDTPKTAGARHELRYNALQDMRTKLVRSPAIDPQYACFQMEIRESRIHHRGVYALERIPARRKVIEYTGERIGRRETKRRGQGSLTYLFTLDDYWTLDGAIGGSGAEIINHSCDPNLVASIRQGHILYFSRRAIARGEELTVDYRFSEKIGRVKCLCGAEGCRGAINLK
jgi:SET domain-containing protein